MTSSIKFNNKNEIIQNNDYHNHNISEKYAPRTKAKSEIKKILKNNDNPFLIKGKNIFEQATKNLGLIISI